MKKLCLILVIVLAMPCFAFADEIKLAIPNESDVFSMDVAKIMLDINDAQTAETARTVMKKINFEVAALENFNKSSSDHSNTSAFAVGKGRALIRGEERNTVIIVVRGTDDGEWYSNFDFASENPSEDLYTVNFYSAAQDIFETAKPYIDEVENPVIIATGYSRGAACANLLGVILDETYPIEDCYIYTFATPNTIHTAENIYTNIFNVINENDFITHMPPEGWGYSRAGVDIVMKDESVDNTFRNKLYFALYGICPTIESYYNDRHNPAAYGLSEDGATLYELMTMACALLTPDIDDTTSLAATMRLAQFMGVENDLTEFLNMFINGIQGVGESIFAQHMPNVYKNLLKNYNESADD